VSVPAPGGGRRQETVVGSRKDAERKRTELLRELDTQTLADPSRLTVGEYLQRWLADYAEPRLKPQTVRGYRRIIEVHLTPALGATQLQRLTPLQLQHYYTQAQKGRDGRGPLAGTTVLQHHHILHTALRQAVRWRLLTVSPADGVEPPRRGHREMLALTPRQAILLLETARPHSLYVPIALALFAGMRRGEVFGLRWSDLDLVTGYLRVSRSLDYTAGTPTFGAPKSERSRRRFRLPENLVEILRWHQEQQTALRVMAGEAYNDHGLVCCLEDGRPRCHAVNTMFTRILVQRQCPECGKIAVQRNSKAPQWVCRETVGGCGAKFPLADARMKEPALPRIRFHDLRHTNATLLAYAKVNARVISERLGHASVAFTMQTYGHVLEEMDQDAAQKLDDLLGGR